MADHTFAVGQKHKFKGYTEALKEGEEPLFSPGEDVIVVEVMPDIDKQGVKFKSLDGTRKETFFPEEIEIQPQETATPPAAKSGKAPAKTDAPAKPAAAKPAGKGGKNLAAAAKAEGAKVAAKKAPVVKEPAKVDPPVVLIDTPALKAAIQESGDAFKAAEFLQDQIEQNFFTLGGVLAHIQHDGLYKDKYPDKGGFEQYVENELEINPRKARYLINIYIKTTAAKHDEKRLASVGWTKARLIMQVMEHPDFNFEKTIKFAEKHTRDELESWAKKTYVKAGRRGSGGDSGGSGSTEQVEKFTGKFAIFGASAEIANAAINKAKELCENDDISKALEYIMTEWATMTNNVEVTLDMELERIQTKFGVNVNAYNEDNELVFGEGDDEGEADAASSETTEDEQEAESEEEAMETEAEADEAEAVSEPEPAKPAATKTRTRAKAA